MIIFWIFSKNFPVFNVFRKLPYCQRICYCSAIGKVRFTNPARALFHWKENTFCLSTKGVFFSWQRVKDLNPHIRSQSPLCYHYTNPLCFAEQILLYTSWAICQQKLFNSWKKVCLHLGFFHEDQFLRERRNSLCAIWQKLPILEGKLRNTAHLYFCPFSHKI